MALDALNRIDQLLKITLEVRADRDQPVFDFNMIAFDQVNARQGNDE